MSLLSPRLQLKVAQKQILTPGLVQMVTVLQLNRLELKEMITQEIVKNPVLEEGEDGSEEAVTPEELLPLLEAERLPDTADRQILDAAVPNEYSAIDGGLSEVAINGTVFADAEETAAAVPEPAPAATDTLLEQPASTDPFDEIDFGSFFDDYLDPGYKSPASESVEKPSFETFLSAPVTLGDYLRSQLSVSLISDDVRNAAESIIGNLDEDGYLTSPTSLEEIAAAGEHKLEHVEEALRVVQSLDPAGVAARTLKECLLLQIESVSGKGGVAWQIVSNHLRLLETHQYKEIARFLNRPLEHIEIAVDMIHHLNPRPGLRYSGAGARVVEPDVYFIKDGDDYIIQMNDEEVPQLRLNAQYKRMLDRDNGATKEVRDYVRERYTSAIQLMKNIEQRKQTILKVCQSIVRRQTDFLTHGIEQLRPMMIKEVAEEVGVHPSTVSRAVASKYVHTPQGVFELRYFFSEAVQGPSGAATPLLLLKRKVKKMIDAEDRTRPLTDEQITALLQAEGIEVTRRTVAKYREDMKIPSTHQRRVRN
ncbi:MAG: RNA polymerase factor sigma-54 [Acidobacteriia bacterium]|nr:RNA polymerase factor sigma-54 [Terriglobia bacterium]MBV9746366.1 RNA polymerase factor sigma-54 [Terriglobia bacterium]